MVEFQQCRDYLEPAEIFKGEVEETIEKVRTALKILHAFKKTYEDHRAKIKDYFTGGGQQDQQQDQEEGGEGQQEGEGGQQKQGDGEGENGVKEWEFAPQLVFHRYDKFVERVETVMVSCAKHFSSLFIGTLNEMVMSKLTVKLNILFIFAVGR